MARYFIELAYKGTNYHGWQRQPNGSSIQQDLEIALSTILQIPISITGAGRTDAGVHAKYMVAHFNTSESILNTNKLVYKLNRFLSKDIVVFFITKVSDDAHSRFDAIARGYEYHLTWHKNPFLQNLVTYISFEPDVEIMNKAADKLMHYSDFTSFSKLHGNNKTNLCKVNYAKWEKRSDILVFNIQADRFLRNMVRAIVGTILEVGSGKLSVTDFCEIIEAKDRGKAGTSVPADGLYLKDVIYPDDIFISNKK